MSCGVPDCRMVYQFSNDSSFSVDSFLFRCNHLMQVCFSVVNALFKSRGGASFHVPPSKVSPNPLEFLLHFPKKSCSFSSNNGWSHCLRHYPGDENDVSPAGDWLSQLSHRNAAFHHSLLRQAITNLQDAAFKARDDELDLEFRGEQESNGTAENNDGNPNASDDCSDAADDAFDGANSGDGSDWAE